MLTMRGKNEGWVSYPELLSEDLEKEIWENDGRAKSTKDFSFYQHLMSQNYESEDGGTHGVRPALDLSRRTSLRRKLR